MSSVKIIYDEKRITKDGLVPIWLRIIKNRKPKYISLSVKVKPSDWDIKNNRVKKSHPNSQRINNYIASKIADAEGILLDIETSAKFVTPKKVKDIVLGKSSESFIRYAEEHIERLRKEGKITTMLKYKVSLDKLKTYLNQKDITFDEMTVSFLKGYHDYLRFTLGNCLNTIHCNIKCFRKLINDAIQEEIMTIDKNPFLRFKLKTENTKRNFLTEDEIKLVEELILDPGKMIYHSRNMFIFACYTGGIRISDLLQLTWNNYDGERLLIRTQKTDSVLSILVPIKAREIIEQYITVNTQPTDFIFPFLKNHIDYSAPELLYKAISSANAFVNSHMKEIAEKLEFDKRLNFHTSRHTWATRALRKGMRIEYVSKLMCHKNLKVTQHYAQIVNEELEAAMEVFND